MSSSVIELPMWVSESAIMSKSDSSADTTSSFENRLHTLLCTIRKFCFLRFDGPGFVSIPDLISKYSTTEVSILRKKQFV